MRALAWPAGAGREVHGRRGERGAAHTRNLIQKTAEKKGASTFLRLNHFTWSGCKVMTFVGVDQRFWIRGLGAATEADSTRARHGCKAAGFCLNRPDQCWMPSMLGSGRRIPTLFKDVVEQHTPTSEASRGKRHHRSQRI